MRDCSHVILIKRAKFVCTCFDLAWNEILAALKFFLLLQTFFLETKKITSIKFDFGLRGSSIIALPGLTNSLNVPTVTDCITGHERGEL